MDDKVRITLRLPAPLHGAIKAQAQAEKRPLNSQIELILEQGVLPPANDAAEDYLLVQRAFVLQGRGRQGSVQRLRQAKRDTDHWLCVAFRFRHTTKYSINGAF